jgi:SpoVK/Ycf46/Vps4 family AAA+-type ATPase
MANPNHCPPFIHRKVVPAGTGSSLRFPSEQIALLRQMAQETRTRFMVPRLRNRSAVSGGNLVLFSGPRGTGKTMAADMLVRELGVSMHRVNLNQVFSKSIGETEKNLARVLKIADTKKAVLLFDEADALFGKRSEVKDSHDRYANIEVNYFMEKVKSYSGLVIFVSNQKVDLDPQVRCFLKYHLNFSFSLPSQGLKGR